MKIKLLLSFTLLFLNFGFSQKWIWMGTPNFNTTGKTQVYIKLDGYREDGVIIFTTKFVGKIKVVDDNNYKSYYTNGYKTFTSFARKDESGCSFSDISYKYYDNRGKLLKVKNFSEENFIIELKVGIWEEIEKYIFKNW